MRRITNKFFIGLMIFAIYITITSVALADSYQYVTTWGSQGSGSGQFDGIGGIAIDPFDNVYVADGNKRIQKFDSNGSYVTGWATQNFSSNGIAVDSSGNVYVTDRWGSRIVKYNSSGAYQMEFDTTTTGTSEPLKIAVDSSGDIWIIDNADMTIKKFNAAGVYLGSLGTSGFGNGQFQFPTAIYADSSGSVYVVDGTKYDFQKFSSSGTFLAEWLTIAKGDANLLYPVAVNVDSSGNIYVGDTFTASLLSDASVKKFNSSGLFLTRIGAYSGSPIAGTFSVVSGIATDSLGNVYVADSIFNRISKFSSGLNQSILSTKMSFKASPKVIKAGKIAKLIGQLNATNGQAVVGKTVVIKAKVLQVKKKKVKKGKKTIIKTFKKWVWKVIAKVKTNTKGQFAKSLRPKTTTIYKAEFSGDSAYEKASSNTAKITVKKPKKKAKKK